MNAWAKHAILCAILLAGAGVLRPLRAEAQTDPPASTPPSGAFPVLISQSDGQPLELTSVSISVEGEGALVETIFELEFFNHAERRTEGEFVMTLPEGATVSTYALEVNGHLRPAISVDKEQARNAYEAIKRRRVDPGLVEREEGNVYRTRIFPLEPRAPKRVRIGYLQYLGNAEYFLPLDHPTLLQSFTCQVRGVKSAAITTPGLTASPPRKTGGTLEQTWKGSVINLAGDFSLRPALPAPGETLVRLEKAPDSVTHFVVQRTLPDTTKVSPRKKPGKIHLIWDASLSGKYRDHAKELEALALYWQWLGNAEVSVQLLRTALEPAHKFSLVDGKSAELDAFLRDIPYDGAADFSALGPLAGVTLLVTDGLLSSPAWTLPPNPLQDRELFILTSTTGPISSSLTGFAEAHINVLEEDAWKELTQYPHGAQVRNLPRSDCELTRRDHLVLVSGHIERNWNQAVKIRFDDGEELTLNRSEATEDKTGWGFARRAWAQQRLAALETLGDEAAIKDYAIAERLVSDHTSLIVLERFEDHLRYRIPPPEPELLTRYNELLLNINHSRAFSRAATAWQAKEIWYRTSFPWVDWRLEQEITTVGIWLKASRQAFPPEQLNQERLAPFDAWLPEAQATINAKSQLKSQAAFDQWKKEIDQRLQRLTEIRARPAGPPPGKPLHVSVRGFVPQRGIITAPAPFTLKEAVERAGGPRDPWGSWSRIFLYRDGARTGYDLENFGLKPQPVPLRWGDMIVVETTPRYDLDYFADPFAAPASGGSRVFEKPGDYVPPRPPAKSFKPKVPSRNQPSFHLQAGPSIETASSSQADPAILTELQNSADPAATYDKLLRETFHEQTPAPATWVEMARLFMAKGHSALAERILSNFLEVEPNPVEATRAFAFWLAEVGATSRAVSLLEELDRFVADTSTRALIQYDLAALKSQANAFAKAVEREIDSGDPGALATIALTDFFGNGGRPGGNLRQFPINAMSSDLRVVITACGGDVDVKVLEPGYKDNTLVFSQGISPNGGRLDLSPRVQEYQIRHGIPGAYQFSLCRSEAQIEFAGVKVDSLKSLPPLTLRVTYYTHWGTKSQTQQTRTYLLTNALPTVERLEYRWPQP